MKVYGHDEIPRMFKERRMNLGISLRDLSLISGLSNPFISQYENGKTDISVSNFLTLANRLGFKITIKMLKGFKIEPGAKKDE